MQINNSNLTHRIIYIKLYILITYECCKYTCKQPIHKCRDGMVTTNRGIYPFLRHWEIQYIFGPTLMVELTIILLAIICGAKELR